MDRKSILRSLRGPGAYQEVAKPAEVARSVAEHRQEFSIITTAPDTFSIGRCCATDDLQRGWKSETGACQWHSTDAEDRYISNSRARSHEMVYSGKDIVYNFNSYGYRSPEPLLSQQVPSVVYLGCSFTLGVGLPAQETWPVLLHSKIESHFGRKLAYHNLGLSGASNDSISRRALSVGVLNPILMVVLYTFIERREYISIPGAEYQNATDAWCPQSRQVLEQGDANNDAYNFLKNRSIVDLSSSKAGCQLVSSCIDLSVSPGSGYQDSSTFFFQEDPRSLMQPFARDLVHPGKMYQVKIATEFFDNLGELRILERL